MNELKEKIVEILQAHKVELFRVEHDHIRNILVLWSHPPIDASLMSKLIDLAWQKRGDSLTAPIEFREISDPNEAGLFGLLPTGGKPNINKADNVNHPAHYKTGKIEVIEFIEDQKLNYHRGNTLKYICRAGRKDPKKEVEDLKKAQWYLNREIERLNDFTK